MSAVKHFLLVFDHAIGRLIDVEEFGQDSKRALSRYEQVEQMHRDNRRMDIVLVGSDSLDTIRVTHANYFDRDNDSIARVEQYLRKFADRGQPSGV